MEHVKVVRPRLLLIGGTDRLLLKAENLAVDIVNLRGADDLTPRAAAVCEAVQVLDLDDAPEVVRIVRALHEAAPFARVLCHWEQLQMLAGFLSTELGIPGTAFATVQALRDKSALRRTMRENGLSRVDSEIITSAGQLVRFRARHGEAIVKPRSGGGSLGVHLVRTDEDAEQAWDWAEKVGLTEMLAEEVLRGPEVSIEIFSIDGAHFPLAATSKTLAPGFVETSHAVPAPITEAQYEAACRLVTSVLDLVGHGWGPSHTEVIFTDGGPELVEAHTRRAGGHINELVSLARGIDMESLCFRLAAGENVSIPSLIQDDRPAAIRFLQAASGRVVTVHEVDQVRAASDVAEAMVYVSPGDLSHGLRWSGDYVGHVIARGATPEAALAAAERHAASITIETAGTSQAAAEMTVAELRGALDAFDESWNSGGRSLVP